jgi:hypothetical protein
MMVNRREKIAGTLFPNVLNFIRPLKMANCYAIENGQ